MRDFDKSMNRVYRRLRLRPGDIYESCSFHPVLCLGVDYKLDEIWGVSLIDGTYPQSCSLLHCGVRKLSLEESWQIKTSGPVDAAVRDRISLERRWWPKGARKPISSVRFVAPRKSTGSRRSSLKRATPERR
jgi:hypothetical protein